jgi:hypothetical protein
MFLYGARVFSQWQRLIVSAGGSVGDGVDEGWKMKREA